MPANFLFSVLRTQPEMTPVWGRVPFRPVRVLFSVAPRSLQQARAAKFIGNSGRIAGTVYTLAIPAPVRRVRLYDRVSGEQVAETLSGVAGAYEFLNVSTLRTYFVAAFDVDTGEFNAVIQDRVVPTTTLGAYVAPPAPAGPGPGNYVAPGALAFNLTGAYTTPAPLAFDLV